MLKRAIKTLQGVLEELDQLWVPVEKSWRLNERHYGDLQGRNKAETAKKFGDKQVHIWRRSYDVPPAGQDPVACVFKSYSLTSRCNDAQFGVPGTNVNLKVAYADSCCWPALLHPPDKHDHCTLVQMGNDKAVMCAIQAC